MSSSSNDGEEHTKKRPRITGPIPFTATKRDLDLLHCPLCWNPLGSCPILLCRNGHSACSPCCLKSKNSCVVCMLPTDYIPDRGLERFLENTSFKCPYEEYGCEVSASYHVWFRHKEVCLCKPCSCPMDNCIYVGNIEDLKQHLLHKHRGEPDAFVWNTEKCFNLVASSVSFKLQEIQDGEIIVIQIFCEPETVYVSVRRIAPVSPETGEVSCTVMATTPEGILKQKMMVKNVTTMSKNEKPDDGYLCIPRYMLADNEDLHLRFWFGRGRCYGLAG